MIGAGGGAEDSSIMKGSLCAACVISVMLYGSKTLGMREEDICRFEGTEMDE